MGENLSYDDLASPYKYLDELPVFESTKKSALRQEYYMPNVKNVLSQQGKLETLSITDIEQFYPKLYKQALVSFYRS